VLGTAVVVQQISVVVAVYLAFLAHRELKDGEFVALQYLVGAYGAVAGLLMLWDASSRRGAKVSPPTGGPFVRLEAVALCTVLTMIFAPLLRTLTESYSSDTVFMQAAFCALVHLYLYDYCPEAQNISTRLDCTMSLNASFLMCLLLASRLEHSEAVASFLLCCIVLLVLMPQLILSFRRQLPRVADRVLFLANWGAFWGLCQALCVYGQHQLVGLYSVVVGFVTIACPLLLRVLYSRKQVVRGPWDEARPAPAKEHAS